MRKIASLDIGSNSILMLVAAVTGNKRIIPLLETSRTPRLAFNLKKTGRISAQNLARVIRDINSFKHEAESYGVDQIYAVGTQAIRAAANKAQVLKTISSKTGLRIEVISGKKEAELTYRGAVSGFGRLNKNRIMFDIGGASSEFVQAENTSIKKSLSLKIGAVEITEKYGTEGLKTAAELDDISRDIDDFFQSRLGGFGPQKSTLIGSGGTVSAYKLLDSKPEGFNPRKIHTTSLSSDRLDNLILRLAGMKLSERMRVIMFEPERAEVIVAGGLILRSLLKYFRKSSFKVSIRSLRWGFLLSKL
jgi:exopolyphosphatase/guanosine-5'-triphosphate,3'-diphosphate pyrophosphatase